MDRRTAPLTTTQNAPPGFPSDGDPQSRERLRLRVRSVCRCPPGPQAGGGSALFGIRGRHLHPSAGRAPKRGLLYSSGEQYRAIVRRRAISARFPISRCSPGGVPSPGESAEQARTREMIEEKVVRPDRFELSAPV